MGMEISFRGGKKFEVRTRGHELTVDLSPEKGGSDEGMTPPELFIASLGTCIGVYAVSYLNTAGIDPAALKMDVDWSESEDHKKISSIKVMVGLAGTELGGRKKALMAAMDKCLIHNTLREHPSVEVIISE
ncbi:MAG: OsmC family protein [Candidatus Omnitrophica bacterium]|nr:OsmC family protein [Candidatus Omnitrophota bacterium]MDD5487674.1 OsmC family protein [Candidatus Omnitrophota bacterium]